MAEPVDPKRVKDIKIKTGIVKRFCFVSVRLKVEIREIHEIQFTWVTIEIHEILCLKVEIHMQNSEIQHRSRNPRKHR